MGGIAQLGERLHGMQEVSGSIPLTSTNFHGSINSHRLAPEGAGVYPGRLGRFYQIQYASISHGLDPSFVIEARENFRSSKALSCYFEGNSVLHWG
jgi:hypothetical protein